MSNYSHRNFNTQPQQTSSTSTAHQQNFGSNQHQQDNLPAVNMQEILSEALNWGGMLLTKVDDLDNNALQDILPGKDMNGALGVASALMTGVQSFQDSPNQTLAGRGLDALLDVSGSLMVGANPAVGIVDTLLPKSMKLSNLYDGTSSAISAMTEGLLTDDTTAMEGFMEKAKAGDYSLVVQEAVEAGEFWGKQF